MHFQLNKAQTCLEFHLDKQTSSYAQKPFRYISSLAFFHSQHSFSAFMQMLAYVDKNLAEKWKKEREQNRNSLPTIWNADNSLNSCFKTPAVSCSLCCKMKVILTCCFVLLSISNAVESRGIRRKKLLADESPDYEASGDYFEVTVKTFEQAALVEATTRKLTSSEESSDDGVTCSQSNFTKVLEGYELENHVLAIFKVNVSSNERELVL